MRGKDEDGRTADRDGREMQQRLLVIVDGIVLCLSVRPGRSRLFESRKRQPFIAWSELVEVYLSTKVPQTHARPICRTGRVMDVGLVRSLTLGPPVRVTLRSSSLL